MKKIVLTLLMTLFFAISFAKNNVYQGGGGEPTQYIYITVCGHVAISYSYEPVSNADLADWAEAMDEYYCEEL